MATTDEAILSLLRDADHKLKGFELLMNKYKERLYWHVRRMVHLHEDADDLLQDIFVKVWKNIDKFRGDAQLYTWLYRIASNECLTFIKKKKRFTTVEMANENYNLADVLEADEHFEGDKAQILLKQAIAKLPEKQQLVFNMRYYDEMKYDDISKALETSVGALKASYHHAAKKIEAFIKESSTFV